MVIRILLVLFFITPFLNAQSIILTDNLQPRQMRLVWGGGEHAWQFAIEIEKLENNDYQSHLREYTTELFFRVSLLPGEYRYRIIPYDILGRPAESSRWVQFTINPVINRGNVILENFIEEILVPTEEFRTYIAEDLGRLQNLHGVPDLSSTSLTTTIERQNPTLMGRIVRLNPETGREIGRPSPLNLVHARTAAFIGGRLIAIAGENRGGYAVRLIEINQDSLTMLKQGDDDIKTGSLLWVNGNDLYAITIDLRNDQCFIGRFDTNLVLQARSTVQVHSEAAIAIRDGVLLTQRYNGAPLLLNLMDLTEIRN